MPDQNQIGNQILEEITQILKMGDPIEEVLEGVLRIIIAEMADGASIDLTQDDGSIARAITRHRDGHKQHILDTYRREHPLGVTASYGYPRVIKTGKSQFIPGVTDRVTNRLFPVREAEMVLDGIAIRSYICVPLIAHGRTLGALSLEITDQNRSFSGEDLLLFEEIALHIAMAIDSMGTKLLASKKQVSG